MRNEKENGVNVHQVIASHRRRKAKLKFVRSPAQGSNITFYAHIYAESGPLSAYSVGTLCDNVFQVGLLDVEGISPR